MRRNQGFFFFFFFFDSLELLYLVETMGIFDLCM